MITHLNYKTNKLLLASLTTLVLLLLTWTIAKADVPDTGTVVEGISAPGVVFLSDTRADVEATYGPPAYCQTWGGAPGNNGWCAYPVSQGQVTIIYTNATNSPNDEVDTISWTLRGWETTAGVSLADFEADPQSAIVAYPNAQVTIGDQFGNQPVRVRDETLGIEFDLTFSFFGDPAYSATIFDPISPLAVELSESSSQTNTVLLPFLMVGLLSSITLLAWQRAEIE